MVDILIVDDEPDILEILGDHLELEGMSFETCLNGDLAWEKISKKPFKVIISDQRMPGKLKGSDLAKKVKSQNKDCFFVLVSGESREGDILDNVDLIMHKPISYPNLIKEIKLRL